MQLDLVGLFTHQERNMCHQRNRISRYHKLAKSSIDGKLETARGVRLTVNWVGVYATIPIFVRIDLVKYTAMAHLYYVLRAGRNSPPAVCELTHEPASGP